MDAKNLLDEREGVDFDSGCENSDSFLEFAKDIIRFIKKEGEKHGFLTLPTKPGHFYLSGFLKKGENFVYYSIPDVRFNNMEWIDHILIRTAQHEKDYSGGSNNYTSIHKFGQDVLSLINR